MEQWGSRHRREMEGACRVRVGQMNLGLMSYWWGTVKVRTSWRQQKKNGRARRQQRKGLRKTKGEEWSPNASLQIVVNQQSSFWLVQYLLLFTRLQGWFLHINVSFLFKLFWNLLTTLYSLLFPPSIQIKFLFLLCITFLLWGYFIYIYLYIYCFFSSRSP